MPKGEPTERQREAFRAWEAAGSVAGAATLLGIHPVTMSNLLRRYRASLGLAKPKNTRRAGVIAVVGVRVAELENRIARLERRIEALEHRPATRVEWHPSHRRIADGGVQVRQQRREAGVQRRVRRVA